MYLHHLCIIPHLSWPIYSFIHSLSLILSFLLCRTFQVIFNGYGCAYCDGLYLRCTRGKVRSDPHNDHLESTNRWIYVQLFSFSVFLNEDTSGQRAQNASIHKSSRNNRTLAYDWRRRASKPERNTLLLSPRISLAFLQRVIFS